LADSSSPLFAQQNGVSIGGLKARKRKENIKPKKQRKKQKKAETEEVSEQKYKGRIWEVPTRKLYKFMYICTLM